MKLPVKWRRGAAVVTAVALAGYLAVVWSVDGERILAAAAHIGLATVGLVLLLSLVNYLLRFGRWQLYVRWQGFSVGALRSLPIYLGGFALTVSPGKAGEAVRCYYLSEEGVPYRASFAMLFVERLLDLLAILILSALILGTRADLGWAIGGAFVLIAIGLLLIVWPRSPDLLRGAAARIGGRAHHLLDWLADTLARSGALLRPPRLLAALTLSIVAWGAEGYGVWLLVSALGHETSPLLAIGIYGLAVLAGAAAIFLPAGLGGTEAAMTGLLVAAGLPVAEAVAVTLICRLATLWFAVAIGLIALVAIELFVTSGGKPVTLGGERGPA